EEDADTNTSMAGNTLLGRSTHPVKMTFSSDNLCLARFRSLPSRAPEPTMTSLSSGILLLNEAQATIKVSSPFPKASLPTEPTTKSEADIPSVFLASLELISCFGDSEFDSLSPTLTILTFSGATERDNTLLRTGSPAARTKSLWV